jgi:GST-like protein
MKRSMSTNDYVPPKVWTHLKPNGGVFESINRPTAGATFERDLPKGKHPLQLYSQGTWNGIKVTMLLEELLEAGLSGAEYDAWLIEIRKGDQFGSGFVDVNPNSKIPVLIDFSGDKPVRIFESGAFYSISRKSSVVSSRPRPRPAAIAFLGCSGRSEVPRMSAAASRISTSTRP